MDLSQFFHPASIAIIGVSHEPKKVGHLVAKNLINQGYTGEIYFINHKFDGKILGRKVYKSLEEMCRKDPSTSLRCAQDDIGVDLAVLAVPADIAIAYLDELNKYKIKNAVIFAAGFKETSLQGAKKEKLLQEKAKEYGINILGPNCIGYINTKEKINLTFLKHVSPAGNIGFISQSGALGSALLDYFAAHINLGFSYFISLGNKTVIDESDALEFLVTDKNTEVIALYIEDVKQGEKFKQTLARVSSIKPVIILKSGRTNEGSKAAVSHTGGMVGDDQIFETVFKQYGAIRAKDYLELLTLLKIFSYKRKPISNSILVLSNAGGAGVLLTDELIKNKLEMMTISHKTKENIIKTMGDESKKINLHNPIDLLGDASAFDYKAVIEVTMKEKKIGAIIVLLTPQANTQIYETAQTIVKMQSHFNKPFYPIFMGKKSMEGVGKLFEQHKIAGWANFDLLPKSLRKILTWQGNNNGEKKLISITKKLEALCHSGDERSEDSRIPSTPLRTGRFWTSQNDVLNLIDSLKLIESAGIPVAPLYPAKTINDLKKITKKTGFPVVAKIVSDKISHKTEVGGVITNIKSSEGLSQAFKKLLSLQSFERSKCGDLEVVVQKMVRGYEILVGAKRDQTFGTVLVIGLGGIMTELIKDITYRVYPFSYEEFKLMINETKLSKIIAGFRGSKPIDTKILYDIVNKVGKLMEDYQEIKEIDINPLMISDKEIRAVDGRIVFI